MNKNEYICYTLQKHGKNGIGVVEYDNEIWTNQKHLEEDLILQILLTEHDRVLPKQQSLGLRPKNLFPNEDITEEFCFT